MEEDKIVGAEAQTTEPVEERPNRKAFAERFSKRHKDVDFEDKEARYSALSDDSDRLSSYEESGRALSNVFEKHRWMASMFEALRKDDGLDPVTWMADNGIDIGQALEDEEYRSKISARIADFQKREVEGAKAADEREKNLMKSAKALSSLGLSDDENLELWNQLFQNVIDPALRGEVSADTWKMVQKARNYDNDVSSARETGALQARNEKIRNRVRTESTEIPPSLPQGGGEKSTKAVKRKAGFFDDMV